MLTPATSPKDLALLLGTTHSKLTFTLYSKGVDAQYTPFTTKKKNGELRLIRAPNPQLKRLQRRLKILLDKLYRPHDAASAFISGRGIVFNAKQHIKKAAVFNIDLNSFYDQINFGRVRGILMAKPYSLQTDTATIIAHICCTNKLLPQGAPTSPVISNMICRKMDRELSLLAKEHRAHYSRYADDITFSFRSIELNDIYVLEPEIRPSKKLSDIIKNNGFSINDKKIRIQNFSERQVVTGLKVNKKVNLDRRYIRTTRAMIFSLSKNVEEANKVFKEKDQSCSPRMELMVAGRINFIGMVKGIDSTVYQCLANKFNNLPVDVKLPIKPKIKKSDLENKLHFYGHENRARLNRCVWVVAFDGVEGVVDVFKDIQATAFMIKGQRVFTASHVFSKAGDPEFCNIYRIFEPHVKYKMKVAWRCKVADILELEFVSLDKPKFEYLTLASNLDTNLGYKLSVVGFPQLKDGHSGVTIIPCTVTNTYIRSTFLQVQVNEDIQAGNSGGPILNAYMEVVGIATNGVSVTLDNDFNVEIAGFNSFVSAKHIPKLEVKE